MRYKYIKCNFIEKNLSCIYEIFKKKKFNFYMITIKSNERIHFYEGILTF